MQWISQMTKKEVELRLTLDHHWFSSPLKSEKKYLHAVFTAKLNVCAHTDTQCKEDFQRFFFFYLNLAWIVADRKMSIYRFSIGCWHVMYVTNQIYISWKFVKPNLQFVVGYSELVWIKNFRLFKIRKSIFY